MNVIHSPLGWEIRGFGVSQETMKAGSPGGGPEMGSSSQVYGLTAPGSSPEPVAQGLNLPKETRHEHDSRPRPGKVQERGLYLRHGRSDACVPHGPHHAAGAARSDRGSGTAPGSAGDR